MIAEMTKGEWKTLARSLAADAFNNCFSTRRGVWFVEDMGVLCLFNNNPYAKHPTLRDRETEAFRGQMKNAGIKVLAYATYPAPDARDAGYTYAMLLDAGEDKKSFVIDAMNEIVAQMKVARE